MAASVKGFTTRWLGVRELTDILRKAGAQSGALAATGLYQEGLKVMAISQREVPVHWGILRSTGTVHAPMRHGTGVEVLLTYGGPAAPYAWIQHERLNLRHDSPTKAKYLEDPVVGYGREFEGALGKRMSWLFHTDQVLGGAWPSTTWRAPAASVPSRTRRQRRSPRRGR